MRGHLLAVVVLSCAVWTTRAGYFTNTGSLNMLLAQYTATLLRNGTVLVAGGVDETAAYLYDPSTRQWRAVTSMQYAHSLHTASLLPDGRVLVAGGFGVSNAELFDPATDTWASTGSLPYPTQKHTATPLLNGKILIAGGEVLGPSDTAYATALVYDPQAGQFALTGSMGTARKRHTATRLLDGRVLVAGGYSAGNYLASAEVYNPDTGTWSPTTAMANARRFHTATLLPNGAVLVAGGESSSGPIALSTAEIYDPASGAWRTTGAMTTNRLYHAATLLPIGEVLVTGGATRQQPPDYVGSGEVFDPATETWEVCGQMTAYCSQHAATLLANGQVLCAADLYIAAMPFGLSQPSCLPDGNFAFGFTNTPAAEFMVLAATNPALPAGDWTALTGLTEVLPGQFQFSAPQAADNLQRFYRVQSP